MLCVRPVSFGNRRSGLGTTTRKAGRDSRPAYFFARVGGRVDQDRFGTVARRGSIIRSSAGIDVADHVEVVVIDVEHFLGVFVDRGMRHRPTDASDF